MGRRSSEVPFGFGLESHGKQKNHRNYLFRCTPARASTKLLQSQRVLLSRLSARGSGCGQTCRGCSPETDSELSFSTPSLPVVVMMQRCIRVFVIGAALLLAAGGAEGGVVNFYENEEDATIGGTPVFLPSTGGAIGGSTRGLHTVSGSRIRCKSSYLVHCSVLARNGAFDFPFFS